MGIALFKKPGLGKLYKSGPEMYLVMAKRRKKKEEEEEEYDFQFPEFDRVEHMKHEVIKGKTVIVSIALAPIFSLLSLEVFKITNDFSMGLMIGIFGMLISLKALEYLPTDTSWFGKKEWATNGAMYFFTWLGIFILLMNPPFGDFTDPVLNRVDYFVEVDDMWVPLEDSNISDQGTYRLMLIAKITDNDAVNEESVTIEYEGSIQPMQPAEDHWFEVIFEEVSADASTKIFIIRMEDMSGNSNEVAVEKVISP